MIFSDINKPTFNEVEAFLAQNESIRYLNTPVFKRYVNSQKAKCAEQTNDMKLYCNIAEVVIVANTIKILEGVWPDIQLDHFNTFFPLLKMGLKISRFDKNTHHQGLANPKVASWLRDNCTGKRFLFMLFQHCKRAGEQVTREHNEPAFLAQKYAEEYDYKLAQTTTDPEILHQLALTGHHGIRYQVARNENTAAKTFEQMVTNPQIYEDLCPFILDAMTFNPNTPDVVKTQCYLVRGYDKMDNLLTDTLKQLEDMRNKDYEVPTTLTAEDGSTTSIRRWRLQEFHDYISYLYLCQSTENIPFNQVTLRNPYKEGAWTVYSPVDSLRLALWARQVGNCVKSREDLIHAGTSEIICIELDGIPNCTVEINGAASRKTEGLRIKEIQKRGLSSGMTRDDDGTYLNLVQRALNSVN